MKLIALEEHYGFDKFLTAQSEHAAKIAPDFRSAYPPGSPYAPAFGVLNDLGKGRLTDMDENRIGMQILSNTSAQGLKADSAVKLIKEANDYLAAAISENPDRYAGFAAIPTDVPEACADELERAVKELGFVGAQISGRTDDRFLDEDCYEMLLAKAEELNVPIYIHPGVPPKEIQRVSYEKGLNPAVHTRFATVAWGWHMDVGTQMLHMVLSGVFDRHPGLKIILGHWGEFLPYYIERIDASFTKQLTGLQKNPSEYLRENMYITPSGMFTQALLDFCMKMIGVDHILFAVDYPYIPNKGAYEFLMNASISDEDKAKIAYANAVKLLHLESKGLSS